MENLKNKIFQKLSNVIDPELNKSIIELGMIKNLQIDNSVVKFDLELTTPACPLKKNFKDECEKKLLEIPEIKKVEINLTANIKKFKTVNEKFCPESIKNVIAIGSGKGGVGKSTVSVNIACAFSSLGAKTALMDTDFYGPNIPQMLGIKDLQLKTLNGKILPIEKFGMKIISMGNLLPQNRALLWRGPMLHTAIQQFFSDVLWNEIDYMIVDLPPGTGDVQISLAQSAPISSAIVVTTPQEVSLADVRKCISMFNEVKIPVIGIIENMSGFLCKHCNNITEIFSKGGGEKLAKEYDIDFLGKIPIDEDVCLAGDRGSPVILNESKIREVFFEITKKIASIISVKALQMERENFRSARF